ncbi:MAG: hypothetical protein ACI915_001609 [Gammaproteobacteria bacterium]
MCRRNFFELAERVGKRDVICLFLIRSGVPCVVKRMNLIRSLCIAARRYRPFALLSPLFVAGCGGLLLEDHTGASPHFDPFAYFAGRTRAWGVVQDWRGRVVRRFDVDIVGTIESGELHLDERFRYADGEQSTRLWQIRKEVDGTLSGTANDIVGTAIGGVAGNAMRWRYAMDLAVGGRQYRIDFDDWLWRLDGDVLLNRSYLRKFGFKVAEVTIFMHRADGLADAVR